MHQGPHSPFYEPIKLALANHDLASAIAKIQCCSPENAHEIYDLIFKDLLGREFYYLKDIKALNPSLWLAFLNRNELCSEIGAKKLCKIIKKIIPIFQKLQEELALDPNLDDLLTTYREIICLIATNKDFLEAIVQDKYFLNVDNKEYILAQLRTMPDIDDDVLFFYEADENEETFFHENDETDNSHDDKAFVPLQDFSYDENEALQLYEKKGPTFKKLQDPAARRRTPFAEYLKVSYEDKRIKRFILSNQDDFLFSVDPYNLNEYIFKTNTFSPQEKLVVLSTLIAALESTNETKRNRASNILNYLLCQNNEVRQLFSIDLSATLNIQAQLLLSACSVAAMEPLADTTQKMLATINACFVPLERAMRECIASNKVNDIRAFFDDQDHLDKLCTLYSYCSVEECHQMWNNFWRSNNATDAFQDLLNTCFIRYPNYLYRKALGHLSLDKNDEVNLNIAKGYLDEAIEHRCIPAHLALAAIYAREKNNRFMMMNFDSFISAQENNQALPSKTSHIYRFLFEIYYTCVCHNPSQLNEIKDELNRVYPRLLEEFEQTMGQALMVEKPEVKGNDFSDPIMMLRQRFERLRVNALVAAPIGALPEPPPLVFSQQDIPPFLPQNAPYYVPPPALIVALPDYSAPTLALPGSPMGSRKEK